MYVVILGTIGRVNLLAAAKLNESRLVVRFERLYLIIRAIY